MLVLILRLVLVLVLVLAADDILALPTKVMTMMVAREVVVGETGAL
jgi:hypothetical protein